MPVPRKDVLRNLQHKGFDCRQDSKHTVIIYRNKQGRKTAIRTLVSRGTKHRSLGEPLVRNMAAQCRLTKDDFLALVRQRI